MKEIEAKILEINRQKVEDILTRVGAKKIFDGEIQTVFFDFKKRTIVKAKNLLRLRKERDKTELTFKKVTFTEAAKVAQEYSIEVSDFEMAKTILENLGLMETDNLTKHRVSYVTEHARFDVDRYIGKYSFIPEFLEIEAESAEQIHEYAAILGFRAEDCRPWSTSDLIRYYDQKKP